MMSVPGWNNFCKQVTEYKYRHIENIWDQYQTHFVINVGINWECHEDQSAVMSDSV